MFAHETLRHRVKPHHWLDGRMTRQDTMSWAVEGDPAATGSASTEMLIPLPSSFRPEGVYWHDLMTHWALPARHRHLGNEILRERAHHTGDGWPERVHCLEWSQALVAVNVEAIARRAVWATH